MIRDKLMHEVKQEYARLAEIEKNDNFINQSDQLNSSEYYYTVVLNKVLNMISYGAFDTCSTGKEIVEIIANNKSLLDDQPLTL